PPSGPEPPGGVSTLAGPPPRDESEAQAVCLLAAILTPDGVALQLSRPLDVAGVLQRYDREADRWGRVATLVPGEQRYAVDPASAPVGEAVRVLLGDDRRSNAVFVCDLARVVKAHAPALGKVRSDPADVPAGQLGAQLLADLDALRPYLLRVGALVRVPAPDGVEPPPGLDDTTPARPAPGLSMEDFLAACDPVLGTAMTEFALVLPTLPGVGGDFDEGRGTLDEDSDEEDDDVLRPGTEPPGPRLLRDALKRCTPTERERYREFLEKLIARSAGYPLVARTLAVRSVLHAIAAGLWPRSIWPSVLAQAVAALGAPGDEPVASERVAASGLAAIGLGLLRTTALRELSRDTEAARRFRATGASVAPLLDDVDRKRLADLASDLPEYLRGSAGVSAAEAAIADVLRPPSGAERAVRFLAEEHGIWATADEDDVIEFTRPLKGSPEPQLLLALELTHSGGPEYVRVRTESGQVVVAAWCAPWFACERKLPGGYSGRAWKLPRGAGLGALERLALPRADLSWLPGEARPPEVTDLLELLG
ncbi:MAG TPA: hypothetical protein VI300_14295, partial [Solirubrobacter sp.]